MMRDLQSIIIKEMNVKPTIDPEQEFIEIKNFLGFAEKVYNKW